MSELSPLQSDLDYLSGKVNIAKGPTTIVPEEFLPKDPVEEDIDPELVSKPNGSIVKAVDGEDEEKEVDPEDVNLNLPEEGLNLNLPEDDKDTDPEPPEADTETPELPEETTVTKTPDPPVDVEPVVEIPSEELLEETTENSEVGEDFEELHEVDPQDDEDIISDNSTEARAFPTNEESTPRKEWDDIDDGPYDQIEVKDDGSKTNRTMGTSPEDSISKTAKAESDSSIYTYNFSFEDFKSVANKATAKDSQASGEDQAQEHLENITQSVVTRIAERHGLVLEWGHVAKDGYNNSFASFRLGRLQDAKALKELVESKLKSFTENVSFKVDTITVKTSTSIKRYSNVDEGSNKN